MPDDDDATPSPSPAAEADQETQETAEPHEAAVLTTSPDALAATVATVATASQEASQEAGQEAGAGDNTAQVSGAAIPRNPAPLNQLSEPTKDGAPDENSRDNCTFTALAWIIRDIGTDPTADGDQLKDAIKGQGATGFEDIRDPRYAAVAKQYGVDLTTYYGTQAQLTAKAHEILAGPAGDVLANVGGGSNYLQSFSDPAHFGGVGHTVVLAHYLSGGLEAMNPWDGVWLDRSDSQWQSMIVWGYIIIATPAPAAPPPPPPTSNGGVPAGWRDDGTSLHAPGTAKTLQHGFRFYVLTHPWPAGRIPVSDEYDGVNNDTYQDMSDGTKLHAVRAQNWAVTLEPAPPPPPRPLPDPRTPAGWRDDGATLSDPNGHTFTGPVRALILASSWNPADVLLRTYDVPAGQSVLVEDGRWGAGTLYVFVFSAIAIAAAPDASLTGGKPQLNVCMRVPTGSELAWIRDHPPAPAPPPAPPVPDLTDLINAIATDGANLAALMTAFASDTATLRDALQKAGEAH